jgi:hypothetical protein
MATKRAMVTATRMVGDENAMATAAYGNEGGGQAKVTRATVTATATATATAMATAMAMATATATATAMTTATIWQRRRQR